VTPIAELIDAAIRESALRDVTIEDPPLEEVIRALYAEVEGSAPS
jgi:ABC-type uncharacterized transport system ATPase subunit